MAGAARERNVRDTGSGRPMRHRRRRSSFENGLLGKKRSGVTLVPATVPSLLAIYWDDLPSRRLRGDLLTSEQALEQAKALARAERDKAIGPTR